MYVRVGIFGLLALAGVITSADGVISVGVTGYTNSFLTLDSVTNNPPSGWWTKSVPGDNTSISSPTEMDVDIQTHAAFTISSGLGASGSVPPTANGVARWNSINENLQTRPTGNMYTLLMAELQNDTGIEANALMVTYSFGVVLNADVVEEIQGHRTYWSTNGAAGTWQLVPALCLSNPTPTITATIRLGSWPPGGRIYLLWADDNGSGADHTYTLDNMRFAATNASPPVDITLNSTTVREHEPSFAMVGILKAVDPDKGDRHVYYLIPGAGDLDNRYFQIALDTIRTSDTFDYAATNRYSIRVRAVDSFGLTCEKAFTITVTPPAFVTGLHRYFAENPAVSNATLGTFDRETADYFWVYQNELAGNGEIDMPVPANTPADTATNGTASVYLTSAEARRIHAAKTAHAIWLDKEGLLPWRLRDYDPNHLRGLFAKTNLFNVQSSSSFYFLSVVDHSPSEVYSYALKHGLVRGTITETVNAVLDDCRSDFLHGSGSYGDPSCAYTLQLALSNYSTNRWRPTRITRVGCHSSSRVVLGLLRSLNIPGYETATGEYFLTGHSEAVFPCFGKVLPHGDHIYAGSLTCVPSSELMPTFDFFAENINTPPCGGSTYNVAIRHEALHGTTNPGPTILAGVRNPGSYGYSNAVQFLSGYAGWNKGLTQEELESAAMVLQNQFTETWTLTVPTTTSEGYVINIPSILNCVKGSRVSLKALPKPGYVFNHWTGDVPPGLETANPLVFDIFANSSMQAVFSRPAARVTISLGNPGETRLWFKAEPLVSYLVQYRNHLFAGSWQTLTNIPSQGNGSVMTVVDFEPQSQRFYRVVSQ